MFGSRDPQAEALQASEPQFEASTAEPGEDAAGLGASARALAANVRVKYEQTGVQYAHRVMIQAGRDQLILSFASNPIRDPRSGDRVLPVQSRIAMTPAGAARLLQSLRTALKKAADAGEPVS